ncbi:hypothetical protein UFOVP684_50 [uncultured Caudovirales phage]|uniref:Uncharacterized protein n=1 Tax=uncultured Caudovirales phage TaxID=2100421 RepID=A0A6J5M617_9CAUD|nr:hypothetical protein UFOVP409_52 [uncultured Caudovirales phage]CAB4157867.1 hypothetical protein UFOVP684_50 [uncultured Caudovirales phage]
MRIPNKFNGYSADGIRLYNDPVTLAAMAATASAAAPAAAATTAAAALPAAAAAAAPLAATAAIPAAASAAIPGLVSSAAPALAGQAAMTAAPAAVPGLIGSAAPVFSAAANPLTNAMATGANGFPINASIGQSVGQAAQPSFFDSFKGFAKENPMLTQMGFSTAKDVLTPDQINPAPIVPVQARGKLAAYDPMSFMNPYQQTVIGSNQPISLI